MISAVNLAVRKNVVFLIIWRTTDPLVCAMSGKYCVSSSRAVLLPTVPHVRAVSPACLFLTMGRDFIGQHCK